MIKIVMVSSTVSEKYIKFLHLNQRAICFQDLIKCTPKISKLSKMSKFVSKTRIIARKSVTDVY